MLFVLSLNFSLYYFWCACKISSLNDVFSLAPNVRTDELIILLKNNGNKMDQYV